MDLLKRIVNYRFIAFALVLVETALLSMAGKLESEDVRYILIAAIVAFIGAQAWENTKGAGQ